jgi:alanine racemase
LASNEIKKEEIMTAQRNKIKPLAWIEVDLKAIKHNLKTIRKLADRQKFSLPTRPKSYQGKGISVDILTVIKADAYGHGMKEVSKVLNKEKVGFFGVSDVVEGVALRDFGIKKPILLFESTLVEHAREIVNFDLMPTVCTLDFAKALNKYAKRRGKSIDIHIKIDTGMGRLGVWYEKAVDFITEVQALKFIRIMGIFTHFPAADVDRTFTQKQIKYLHDLVIELDKKGIIIPFIHAANSLGLAGYDTQVLNLSRPGLMLYGLYPHISLKEKFSLKAAMSVKSRIIFLKDVKKKRSISYGRTFFTKKDIKVATIPIGYNDGYFRLLSNKAFVLIGGVRCPVIGQVTMDQIMIDVSQVKSPKVGDEVVILGKQKQECIVADELAKYASTINYEIICSFGNRLKKIYLN